MTHSLLVRPIAKKEWAATSVVAFFFIVLMPLMNSLGWISDFTINLWGKYLCYAMLAISVDLLWGYTGLLSLGQALFFSLGGYMMGMYLMRMIGDLGQYHKDMPDFLVFLGWDKLPTFWKPFSSFPFAMLMMLLIPGIVGYVFGWLAFRSRVRGVYFSILTQALTYGASLMFFRNDMLMGGNNGFTDFRFILGFDIRSPGTKRGLFIITAIVLSLTYAGLRCLTRSRFGLVQQAVRDSENRVLFSGYSSPNFKLFIFVLSSIIGSIGGALYVPQVGIINPSEMTTEKSLEAVVWTAVGGRGTLIGPIVGAVSVNALKSWATRAYPDLWLIILGGMFIIVVLFLPKGIVGVPGMVKSWLQSRKPPEEPDSLPLTKVADKAE